MRRKPHLGFDERSEMAKQSCRPDQIEMPLRPFKIGLSGFLCFGGESGRVWPNPAESVKKGCVGQLLGQLLRVPCGTGVVPAQDF